jgi:large subunit ribosomal protein L19
MIELATINQAYKKSAIPPVKSGDSVRVHQTIREGSKQRVQVFEGVVIRTDRLGGLTASVTVRRIASGVGVEKSFLLHSPNLKKVEIMRRAKVRRNYLSYLRARRGKSARLTEQGFDRAAVNAQAEDVDSTTTELNEEQIEDAETEVEASTEQLADEENQQAGEASGDDVAADESNIPAEETQIGLDRAEQEAADSEVAASDESK